MTTSLCTIGYFPLLSLENLLVLSEWKDATARPLCMDFYFCFFIYTYMYFLFIIQGRCSVLINVLFVSLILSTLCLSCFIWAPCLYYYIFFFSQFILWFELCEFGTYPRLWTPDCLTVKGKNNPHVLSIKRDSWSSDLDWSVYIFYGRQMRLFCGLSIVCI